MQNSESFNQHGSNLKRILWSLGVGLGGFFIGGIGGGPVGSAVGFVWGACVGFGFGSIFSNKQVSKRVVVYWALTLALVGTFFGLVIGAPVEPSVAKENVVGAIGASLGALFGSLVGTIQLWRRRRKPEVPHSDSIA
jgi:hypothetical protein